MRRVPKGMHLVAPAASAASPRRLERLERLERLVAAAAGGGAALLLTAWEIARPTLPAPFELAAVARGPAAATWEGRLPMALAATLGLVALYMLLARTADRRTGVYAAAVLATTPAWFVHGRLMTGAIVPMVCGAGVLAGLGLLVLDPAATARRRALAALAALGAAALAIAAPRWGIAERGLLPVVGVPAIAVGFASVLMARSRLGSVVLAVGVLIGAASVLVLLLGAESSLALRLLGARAAAPPPATFDAPVTALAYGLVPWTPFVPFALARRPSSAGHLAVMLGAAGAIAAHALLAPRSGPASVVGLAAIAGAVAAMMRTLEDVRRPSVSLVASILVIGWLVAHDVGVTPDRVLVAFGTTDTAMPAAHAAASSLAVRSAIWLAMVLAAVALLAPRAWLPSGRGLAMIAAGVLAGLLLRVHAYPELLGRLSPGAAFDAWAHAHRPGEPLGLVGVDPRSVAFAPATAVAPQRDARLAGEWLAAAPSDGADPPRRFLALAAAELPRVNAAFRAARGANVPILAGQDGATLLATSAFAPGEHGGNPLDAIVLASAPPLPHALSAVLDDRLEALGWDVVDERGHVIEAVPRGSRHAHVRLYLRSRSGPVNGYCTFLHVDHTPARFSAEHRELAYPMAVWRAGDVVVDDFDVKLPAHFRAGRYPIFWGVGALPCEDDRRMHVTEGPNDGHDRIPAGSLEVR